MRNRIAIASVMSVAAIAFLLLLPDFRETGTGVPLGSEADTNSLGCVGCNLILLNIELFRADYVGLLNPHRHATPVIDNFFSRGMIFSDVSAGSGATYLSATATATATETMLNEHDIWNFREPGGGGLKIPYVLHRDGKLLIDYFPTIAQVLSQNGYGTTSINQWIHSGKLVSLDRGFDSYIELPKGEAQLLFEQQIDVVMEVLNKVKNKLFYLYFHPNSLHFNFHYPLDRATETPGFLKSVELLSRVQGNSIIIEARKTRPPETLVWRIYEEQVKYIDEQLGRLFSYLEEKGLLRNTIVVLYSNHGVGMNRKNKMEVGLPYQSYLHVPLLIRHPHVQKQVRVGSAASLVDLAPTLYEMLGIGLDHKLTTHSMVSLVEGGEYQREYIYSKDIQYESIRKNEWKMIVIGGQAKELYNLVVDPQERDNVQGSHPEVTRELEAALTQKQIQQLEYANQMKAYFSVPKK